LFTVFPDDQSRRALHGVWMSRTAAVRALRTGASGTHPRLRATGADLLREPGSLSSVSALRTSLLNYSQSSRRRVNATSGNPRSVSTHFQLLIFLSSSAVSTFRLPSMHTNDTGTRVEKNFWRGKYAKLSFSRQWEFVSRKHRVYFGGLLHNKLCRGLSRSLKKFFPRFADNRFLTCGTIGANGALSSIFARNNTSISQISYALSRSRRYLEEVRIT